MNQSAPAHKGAFALHAGQLLTMTGWRDKDALDVAAGAAAVRARDEAIVGLVEDARVVVEAGSIVYAGPRASCPVTLRDAPVRAHVPLLTPAWVECHTHALFAGSRSAEFGLRNAGVPYVSILEAGGGILSTVNATRKASDEELLSALVARLKHFAARGVGTVEVKTGYGLGLGEELRHLRLIREAATQSGVRVDATFLGAHAIPHEYREKPERYVELVIHEMLPRVAAQGIATACDVFCDRGAFSLTQSERILRAAQDVGLAVKIHAEELSHTGGAAMAARLGALSADHCDHLDQAGVSALAESACVAVLLPGVTVFLDMPRRPPARALIDGGARVALSTDFNPGSSMTQDIGLMTTLGCTLLKMTPGEALWAVTAGAAGALGRDAQAGSVVVGRPADVAAFDVSDYRELPYAFGRNAALWVMNGGVPIPT